MYQKLPPEDLTRTAERLLREAAARYGAVQTKAAREWDAQRAENAVQIVITDNRRGLPHLIPGEVYETQRGFRDWRGRPVFYVQYAGRPREVHADECAVLEV